MQRLKSRPQFQAVLAGELVAKTTHFALHRLVCGAEKSTSRCHLFATGENWIGAMAPKRWAKRAVTRNAIKRQIYNVCSDLRSPLLSSSAVFLIRLRREFSRSIFPSGSSDSLKNAVRAELQVLVQAFQQASSELH